MKNGLGVNMRTIGRLELASIPSLNIIDTIAKIDTGAYGCSIHADTIIISGANVIFTIDGNSFTLPTVREKPVKNSNGVEHRIFVELEITIANITRKTLFSLSNRKHLRWNILIGRKFLKNHFIVDVSKTFVWSDINE